MYIYIYVYIYIYIYIYIYTYPLQRLLRRVAQRGWRGHRDCNLLTLWGRGFLMSEVPQKGDSARHV